MSGLDRLEWDRATGSATAPATASATASAIAPPGAHGRGLQSAILVELRRAGPMSPDVLAGRTRSSRTAVLQQLRSLEDAGLVTRQTVRHGVGRPRHLYDVTRAAQARFPANYDGLAADVLAAIESVGGEQLVDAVFDARRIALSERVATRLAGRLATDASLGDRVRELAAVQDEQGYLCHASIKSDGTSFRIAEYNCAIHDVALAHQSACQAEVALFEDVLGADVVRLSHIAAGDRCCEYEVRPRT